MSRSAFLAPVRDGGRRKGFQPLETGILFYMQPRSSIHNLFSRDRFNDFITRSAWELASGELPYPVMWDSTYYDLPYHHRRLRCFGFGVLAFFLVWVPPNMSYPPNKYYAYHGVRSAHLKTILKIVD